MKRSHLLSALCASIFVTTTPFAQAIVVEVGDLNIINDAGNSSDGLRFLDMTYSDGLTLAAALTNAQATYTNARVATASEFDDLFAAAGIGYDGTETASAGFGVGDDLIISSGSNYDSGVLSSQLGFTHQNVTNIWTDPDGQTNATSTRDYIILFPSEASSRHNSAIADAAASELFGWAIVSEVPIPAAAWLFGSALIGLAGVKRKK